MKRLILTFLVVVSFASFANAQHIGPATPVVNISGGVASPNVGVGYSYVQSEWDADDLGGGDVEMEQNQAYAHIGAVFGDESTPNYEVFARIGVADVEDDDDFDFEADEELMFAVGMRNEFYQGQVFGIGGVIQVSYIDSFDDNTTILWGGTAYDGKISIENVVDAELAIPVQVKANNALFYFGPVGYISTADINFKGTDGFKTDDTDIDENHNLGVYGGLAWRTGNISLEFEGKYKSDLSVGGFVSFVF